MMKAALSLSAALAAAQVAEADVTIAALPVVENGAQTR